MCKWRNNTTTHLTENHVKKYHVYLSNILHKWDVKYTYKSGHNLPLHFDKVIAIYIRNHVLQHTGKSVLSDHIWLKQRWPPKTGTCKCMLVLSHFQSGGNRDNSNTFIRRTGKQQWSCYTNVILHTETVPCELQYKSFEKSLGATTHVQSVKLGTYNAVFKQISHQFRRRCISYLLHLHLGMT